jgi:hypothetical protein
VTKDLFREGISSERDVLCRMDGGNVYGYRRESFLSTVGARVRITPPPRLMWDGTLKGLPRPTFPPRWRLRRGVEIWGVAPGWYGFGPLAFNRQKQNRRKQISGEVPPTATVRKSPR